MIPRSRLGTGPQRTHVDEASDPGRSGGLQDTHRALGVHAFEGDAGGGVLANDADEMDDGVAAGDAVLEAAPSKDVTFHPLDRLQATQVPLGASTHETAHGVAVRTQGLDDGTSHEARGAGDKDPSPLWPLRLHSSRIAGH